jgi:hypothetical protein
MPKQRWVFTQAEVACNGKGCESHDEFIATLPEDQVELGVIVYRNGRVSNRWADGTAGVPKDLAELASEVETLSTPDGELADEWHDVEADQYGRLKRIILQPA